MASSFREILWLDTDITLLYRPEELFDSPQYQSTSALSSESTLLRHASQKRPSKNSRYWRAVLARSLAAHYLIWRPIAVADVAH